MRSLLKIVLVVIALMAVACDPGMTVRQTNTANSNADQTLTVHVKTEHLLIGEQSYEPEEATATNLSDTPVTVMNVELIASGVTYANRTQGKIKYPLTIAAGKTETLPVWFDLNDSVKHMFEKTVEMRVHYRSGGKDLISSAFLVGGPLDTNAP